LESALALRRRQCEIEERKLEGALATLRRLDEQQAALDAARNQAQVSVRSEASPPTQELWSLSQFLARTHREQTALAERRARQHNEVEGQRRRVIEAQRQFRLLEQLKERRLQEWRRAYAQELESLASEAYLSRWKARP
jgi:flagellar export protein FliJ